jgi:antirestriction protein ArdC
LGLSPVPRPDHAAYLKNWLTVLRNDSKALWKAASLAQKAHDYIAGKEVVEGEEEAAA